MAAAASSSATPFMHSFRSIDELDTFTNLTAQLGVVKRDEPTWASGFFAELMRTPIEVSGMVRKEFSEQDIRHRLKEGVTDGIQKNLFYETWVSDMAEVCRKFCDTLGTKEVRWLVTSNRGCRRYHIDNVPYRMLVTYAGASTEYLPDQAADRNAFATFQPNEKIVLDSSAIGSIGRWNIAIFRGGPDGLLHRTPNDALIKPSVLMRLDIPSFLSRLIQPRYAPVLSTVAAAAGSDACTEACCDPTRSVLAGSRMGEAEPSVEPE